VGPTGDGEAACCWLGVGRLRKWASHYRRSIVRFVQLLRRNHLYVILDDP
jgi:hypothetical protein